MLILLNFARKLIEDHIDIIGHLGSKCIFIEFVNKKTITRLIQIEKKKKKDLG